MVPSEELSGLFFPIQPNVELLWCRLDDNEKCVVYDDIGSQINYEGYQQND